jgi:hypothetical protein
MSFIAFLFIFGGAVAGILLRAYLPDHHLIDDSRDVVKLGAGLVATLAALVLGLLVSSGKSTLDTMNSELVQSSTKIIELDRSLANYGPETKEIRDLLKKSVTASIGIIDSGSKSARSQFNSNSTLAGIEKIKDGLRALSPRNDSQLQLKTQALQFAAELTHFRWLLIEQAESPLPMPFLVILLFWLTCLFMSFGILAPRNSTVAAVLFVCAVSVSGAIFLILEMNTPLSGIINVSSAPLSNALGQLGK